MNEVGFLGLGAMGRPMAERLITGGHKLAVFDIRREAVEPLVSLGARRASVWENS
jgi:3-hydroxyisobutyrate dehydrogenase-like beta-hydroxyacid dehydrogenase